MVQPPLSRANRSSITFLCSSHTLYLTDPSLFLLIRFVAGQRPRTVRRLAGRRVDDNPQHHQEIDHHPGHFDHRILRDPRHDAEQPKHLIDQRQSPAQKVKSHTLFLNRTFQLIFMLSFTPLYSSPIIDETVAVSVIDPAEPLVIENAICE